MKRTLFPSMLVFLIAANFVWGQMIPQTISYQGVLTDAGGTVVQDGLFKLTFKIYDAHTAGNLLWTEVHSSAVVNNGVFNVILGSINPSTNPLNLAFDKPYWLGVTVGTGPELTPRIELTSSATSLNTKSIEDNAVTSAKIADGSVNTADLANNAVTAAKVAPDIVSSINGVVNDGGNINLVAGTNIIITPDDGADTITIAATAGVIGPTGPIGGNDGEVIYNDGGAAAGSNIFFDDLNSQGGIGTTTPGVALDVVGTIQSNDGNIHIDGADNFKTLQYRNNGSLLFAIGTYPTSVPQNGGLYFQRWPGGNVSMFMNRINGNIGIGTSTPSAKLDIAGNLKIVDGTQGSGKVLTSDANGLASWQMPSGGSGGSSITDADSDTKVQVEVSADEDKIRFDTAGFERMIIDENGNVGIGTATPQSTLDVAGKLTAGNIDAGAFGFTYPSANTVGSFNVTFSKTFSSTPFVVVTLHSAQGGVPFTLYTTSTTTTGFTFEFKTSITGNGGIRWMAFRP